ncbi:MAG: hypothetical protein K2G01_02000, partial [Paramuribaculum sp.]|nr:hypothetical protein [Paramuribaculum sp.]
MKRVIIILLAYPLLYVVMAQKPQNPIYNLSPIAQSFNRYGDIPVSLYTGTPNITIPLDTFRCGNFSLPISLSYHSGGIKVDEHPGNVGLGWTLIAGGAITRRQRGHPDEWEKMSTMSGVGYLHCFGSLAGMDGKNVNAYMSEVMSSDLDTEPDKFSFNFNGYNGFFILDEKGNWQVYSNRPVRVKSYSVGSAPAKMANGKVIAWQRAVIRSFTLLCDDGMEYIFGADDSQFHTDDSPAIDLAVNMEDLSKRVCTSQAWYLRRIPLVGDREIIFNYNREKYVANISDPGFRLYSDNYTYVYMGNVSGQLISPVHLSSIESFSGKIIFKETDANDLKITSSWYKDWFAAETHNYFVVNGTDLWDEFGSRKLTEMKHQSAGGIQLRQIRFAYVDEPSIRLALEKVSIIGADVTVEEKYSFKYNGLNLMPGYLSKQTDHWGYSRVNKHISEGIPLALPANDNFNNHTTNRFTVGYGVISSISYPSGGRTDFEFEPNCYTRVWSLSSTMGNDGGIDETQSAYAGGVRIRKMSHYPENGSKPLVTKYSYMRSETDNNECGILEGLPVYSYTIPLTYPVQMSANEPLSSVVNDYGFHIGYPCVTEEYNDGSKSVSEYTSVLEYPDENPDAACNFFAFVPHTSNASLRGQLKAVRHYDAKGRLTSSSSVGFTISPYMSAPSVRGLHIDVYSLPQNQGSGSLSFMLYSLYKTKLVTIKPSKRIDTTIDPVSGSARKVTTYMSYNKFGQLSSDSVISTVSSNNYVEVRHYRYAFEDDINMKVPGTTYPVRETSYWRNGRFISKETSDYYNVGGLFQSGRYVTYPDGSVKDIFMVNRVDKYGNIVELTENGCLSKIYLWDKNYRHPVAEIIGVDERDLRKYLNYPLYDAPIIPDIETKIRGIRNAFPYGAIRTFEFNQMDQ